MMNTRQETFTETQSQMIRDLDDIAEHVAWEFDPDDYRGISTIGFAHIDGIDGRSSFVQRVKSLADVDEEYCSGFSVRETRRGEYRIEVGSLDLRLSTGGRNGWRLAITDVSAYIDGPEHQRLDVRERLHRLVLRRAQYHGYLDGARVYSRMD